MEIYDLMFVTIINTLVSKIDGWMSSIIDRFFSLKKYLVESAYDIYYGKSLSVTHTTPNISCSEYPKFAIEAYNTVAEYLQLSPDSFICQIRKIVRKPANVGDDRLSVSFERETIREKTFDENGDEAVSGQRCNFTATIKSRIHTPDEFVTFVQDIVNRATNTITEKKIIDQGQNCSNLYNLDDTDKIYYPEFVDAIHKVISTKTCGNFLLHGPPGTGKTNIIKHIANKFGAIVYIVNFNRIRSAHHFRQMLSGCTEVYEGATNTYVNVNAKKRFMLFEDFDSTKTKDFWAIPKNGKDKKKKTTVVDAPIPEYDSDDSSTWGNEGVGEIFTYADLINTLDGFIKIPGVYTFWTTNYIEKINPSFYRPGRMHYTAYVGPLTTERANEFVDDHFDASNAEDNEGEEGKEMITRESVTIAELHSILTQTSNRADFVAKINDMYLDKMMTGGIKPVAEDDDSDDDILAPSEGE